jgi:hypothetical protein
LKKYIGLTLLLLFTVMRANSMAVQITVGSGNAEPGQTVSLPITVDVPGEIAGAAFTLTYDKTRLTLNSVTSTFFDTFTHQWNSLSPIPNPLPPATVTVDGQTYDQPLVKNPVSVGMSIAAARCKAGAVGTTLFTLTFAVGGSVAAGPLPVRIIPTVLNNMNAGYPVGGEAVPILIGALENQQNLASAYPVLPSTLVSGTVNVIPHVIVDSDGDGIDDGWEMAIFGDLTTANATSDFDRDGYSDLQEYLNITDGLFDPSGNPYDLTIRNAPGGRGYQPPAARVNFNGDAKTDILLRNIATGVNLVWFMDGVMRTGTASLPAASKLAWTIGGVDDFNGDGKPDILWRRLDTGANAIWFMDGTTCSGTVSLLAETDTNWIIAGTGDFNGDGKPDILWRNASTGANSIWFMNGTIRTGTASLQTSKTVWTIGGVGDFNGDGKPDILWRRPDTGANAVWFMDGTTCTGTASLPTTSILAWTIGGVGDFNGDGKPDILWRRSDTGKNAVWFMDGTKYVGTASLPAETDLNWKIVNH